MTYQDMLTREPLEPALPFDRSEYDRRVEGVRARMREQGIDLLLVSNTSNWAYLTGYDTTMPSCYGIGLLPAEGELAVHTAELEVPCVLYNSYVTDVIVYEWYDARSTAEQLADALAARGYDGKTIGVEMGYPETFAIGAYDARSLKTLEQQLNHSTFVDATSLVLDMRMIKSTAELEQMRRAGMITWEGLKASLDAVAEGRSDQDVVAAGYQALMASGSELTSIDGMCMVGHRAGLGPHMPFKRTTLQQGDTVYLEYTGTYHRYNAPSMRSAVIGRPSAGVSRLADAAIETLQLLVSNIAPGRTGDDVARAAKAGLKPVADEAWFHGGYGYSIGLGMQPSWTEAAMYIAEGEERELRPGMTFHLPICIFVPRQYGTGFSESVVVTETGCELLTPGKACELAVR
ncbi:MAG TPA: Xaa-Pro peptidase family protein [Egibacteraceae bacterium]|nr:Xaa-Pro peptidase family protein [Egibacteraceae bacterium]